MKLLLSFLVVIINIFSCFCTKTSDDRFVKVINNIKNLSFLSNDYKNEKINILIKLNYEFDLDLPYEVNDDKALEKYRDEIKNYYFYYNEYIVETLKITNYKYSSSYYSPYVEIIFDNYSIFEKDDYRLINILNYSTYVDTISINCNNFEDENENSNSNVPNYSFKQALNDVGLSNYVKSGDNIKVGVIENYVPKSTNHFIDNHYFLLTSTTSNEDHCGKITSIIGGKTGIAKNVCFYCIGLNSNYTFTGAINELVKEYKVNIINMSMELTTNSNHENGYYYNDYCEYLDYIVNSAKVTIVKSSGNDGTSISIPGCGLNVITVGASNCNREVSSFSSWQVDPNENYLYKPDFVAPGENISLFNPPKSGTSYAVPFVTGIIALLMEEFPALKTNPSLVKAALQIGCNKINGQTFYYDERAGFGLINYSNTRKYLIEHSDKTLEFVVHSNSHNCDLFWSGNVKIPPMGHVEINSNWLIQPSNHTEHPDNFRRKPLYSRCTIRLVDLITGEEVETSALDSNMGFINYYNMNDTEKEYRIEVRLDGEKKGTYDEIGSIVYHSFEHPHEYSYRPIDRLKHKRMCMCGENSITPHVLSASDFNPLKESRCLLCNGIADMGFSVNSLNENLYRTINGSYILPNGVIVLVDEDFEQYLEGTLEFYNYNEM